MEQRQLRTASNPLVNDENEYMHMITISEILASMDMTNATASDYDNDSVTNMEEVQNGTDPCTANTPS
jgi:hypothetical protein